MKKFAIVLFALLVSATFASAQTITGFVEGQIQVVNAKIMPTLDFAVSHPLQNGWSIEGWALKCDGWSEAYIGLGKQVRPWAFVSFQAGLEQNSSPWRVAGTLLLNGKKMYLFANVEEGGSSWWHKVVANREITKHIGLGVMSQRYVGTGPYAEVKLGKTKIWVVVPVTGGTGVLVGVLMGF